MAAAAEPLKLDFAFMLMLMLELLVCRRFACEGQEVVVVVVLMVVVRAALLLNSRSRDTNLSPSLVHATANATAVAVFIPQSVVVDRGVA